MMDVFENDTIHLCPSDAVYIRELIGGRLELRADGWAITRVAGHVALPSGDTLRIRSPKADVAAILAWAAYVDPRLHALRFLKGLPASADLGDIGAVVARLFVDQTIDTASRNGLIRQYQSLTVRSSTLRGRIEFTELARSGGTLSKVPCTVWQRLPETPLNQFLSAALRVIRMNPVMRQSCRERYREIMALLGGVRPRVVPRLLSGKEPLPRNERVFETACALARMLVTHFGLTEGSQRPGPAFLVNLESLFERAVIRAFREAQIACSPHLLVRYDALGSSESTASPPPMNVDVFLRECAGGPVVVDAKYKSSLSAANLQQVVTYCFLTGAKKAVLVFPMGHLREQSTFRFPGKGLIRDRSPATVDVSLVEFRTDAGDVEGWRANAQVMVENVKKAVAVA